MKEIKFINANKDKWIEFEQVLDNNKGMEPDKLAELFMQITDDLSYSRTYYAKSKITIYLNSLAFKAHQLIYKNKKEKSSKIYSFWSIDYPIIIYKSRKYLLYSFIIFFISILIGVISTANDDSFVRLILGDLYVNMTLQNIEKGDPMAVYKSATEMKMFLGITINNIRVSFIAFVFGIFISLGTSYVLFFNGVMLGRFQ